MNNTKQIKKSFAAIAEKRLSTILISAPKECVDYMLRLEIMSRACFDVK
jgi:hypothetical protein